MITLTVWFTFCIACLIPFCILMRKCPENVVCDDFEMRMSNALLVSHLGIANSCVSFCINGLFVDLILYFWVWVFEWFRNFRHIFLWSTNSLLGATFRQAHTGHDYPYNPTFSRSMKNSSMSWSCFDELNYGSMQSQNDVCALNASSCSSESWFICNCIECHRVCDLCSCAY